MTVLVPDPPARSLWWRRSLVHWFARLRRALRRPVEGIVPGVVIISFPVRDEWAVRTMKRLERMPGNEPAITLSGEGEGSPWLVELHCRPGTEAAVARTVRKAVAPASTARRSDVLVSRLPEVEWASDTIAPNPPSIVKYLTLELARRAMRITADEEAGCGVVVGIVDEDIVADIVGREIIPLQPDANPEDPPFTPSKPHIPLHGTAVAAAIADIAPAAELVALTKPENVKLWLPGMLLRLVTHAGNSPIVVNLSLSYRIDRLRGDERQHFEDAIDGAIRVHYSRMLLVAAAGNAVERTTPMAYPGRSRYVIGICAANTLGVLSGHSRHGKDVGGWYLFPGGYGDTDRPAPLLSIGGSDFCGTSMACALASGFIARTLRKPDGGFLSPQELRDLLPTLADVNRLLGS